jgi:hypothetical protein
MEAFHEGARLGDDQPSGNDLQGRGTMIADASTLQAADASMVYLDSESVW